MDVLILDPGNILLSDGFDPDEFDEKLSAEERIVQRLFNPRRLSSCSSGTTYYP